MRRMICNAVRMTALIYAMVGFTLLMLALPIITWKFLFGMDARIWHECASIAVIASKMMLAGVPMAFLLALVGVAIPPPLLTPRIRTPIYRIQGEQKEVKNDQIRNYHKG